MNCDIISIGDDNMNKVYEFFCVDKGGKAVIEINNSILTISRPGLLSKLSQGFKGDKSIMIEKITSVQVKKNTIWTRGYIQFTIAGEIAKNVGAVNGAIDENIIYFSGSKKDTISKYNEAAEEIKKYVEDFNSNQNNTVVVQNVKSPVEQVKELKELLDMGAISQEEFDKKKKELLDL